MEKKQVQIALFFKKILEHSIEEVSLLIKKKLGNPKSTIYLPSFPELPPDVPRLVLEYDSYKINFSLSRADLFTSSFNEKKNIKEITKKLVEVIVEDIKLEIGRVGFVKILFIERGMEELKELLNPARIKKLPELKELAIRINTPLNILGYECNNIENLSRGITPEKKEGIIILRDINTLSEKIEEYVFSVDKVMEILEEFDKESEKFSLIKI